MNVGFQEKGDSCMPEGRHQYSRFPVENAVYIELLSPDFGSNESGTMAICKTLSVSREGLHIALEQELPVAAILQFGLELPAGAGTLYLVGEVKWSHPIPGTGAEPGWSAGLALLDADESDIESWAALITIMES
jgi:hypothetical protein